MTLTDAQRKLLVDGLRMVGLHSFARGDDATSVPARELAALIEGAESVTLGSKATLEIRQISVPSTIIDALRSSQLGQFLGSHCTLHHAVWIHDDSVMVGVFGDSANGFYEWFIFEAKGLRVSEGGFGNPSTALCCGLVEAQASMANGDHDLALTWKRESL